MAIRGEVYLYSIIVIFFFSYSQTYLPRAKFNRIENHHVQMLSKSQLELISKIHNYCITVTEFKSCVLLPGYIIKEVIPPRLIQLLLWFVLPDKKMYCIVQFVATGGYSYS